MNVRYRVTLETSERVQLVAMVLGGKTTMRYVTLTGAQLDAAIALTFGQHVGNEPNASKADENAEKRKPLGDQGFSS